MAIRHLHRLSSNQKAALITLPRATTKGTNANDHINAFLKSSKQTKSLSIHVVSRWVAAAEGV